MRKSVLLLALISSPGTLIAAATPVVVDANGSPLGYYVGADGTTPGETISPVYVITTTGYSAIFDPVSGELSTQNRDPFGAASGDLNVLHYMSADCSGPAYTSRIAPFTGGVVMRQITTNDMFYIQKAAQLVIGVPLSRRSAGGACLLGTGTSSTEFFEVLPNDPLETGVPVDPFIGPLRIEVADLGGRPDFIFHDGFEGGVVRV